MKTLSMNLDLPDNDTHLVSTIRHTSSVVMEAAGVPRDQMHDVELILGELCTNVMMHGHSQKGHFTVMLRCGKARRPRLGSVVLCVVDYGGGFDNDEAYPERGMVEHEVIDGDNRYGGWGMQMVRDLSDTAVWSDTVPSGPGHPIPIGTTVKVTKWIRRIGI